MSLTSIPPISAEAAPPPPGSAGNPSMLAPPEVSPSSDQENRDFAERNGIFYGTEASEMLSPRVQAIPSMGVQECRDNDKGDDHDDDADGRLYGGWVKDHASYCQWQNVKLEFKDIRGKHLGDLEFKFTMRGWAWQADNTESGRRVDFGITFDEWDADEGILNEDFTVAMVCQGWPQLGSCVARSPLRVKRKVSDWIQGEPEILFAFHSPNSRPLTTSRERRATGAFQAIFLPGILGPWTKPARSWPNTVRFDSAWYLKSNRIEGSRSHGTIFDRVLPFLRFRTSDTRIAQEAQHIWDAQNNAQTTHPQWDQGTKTIPGKWPGPDWKPGDDVDYLHRIYRPSENPNLRRQNHAAAVRTCVAEWGEDYTTDPVTGEARDCDEYPFASTYEGAAKGDNRYSARPIDRDHNQTGGRILGTWYSLDRIIHNDRFTIDVVDDDDDGGGDN
ncbi:NucA/NucB deoxyribonuclease domain-containing protein [Nonomuraea sp. NPDC023979]|uniref:NucA/NucB deoxyribonuclease domain-containing protein n=1 Tax=Nonomuraea sp. NPDC023979 TaxID=3154796 RepID=UPI0033E224A5